MASSGYLRPNLLLSNLCYLLLLFTTLLTPSFAQSTIASATPTAQATASRTSDTFDPALNTGAPSDGSYPTGYHDPDDPSDPDFGDDGSHRLLNYFFLLLLALVATTIAAYFLIIRRRQQRVARLQGNRQDALAHDLERWDGFRLHRRRGSNSRVEGLNESGEAPPAYMPDRPAETHPASGSRHGDGAIPLQDMHKPPDYEEGHTYPPGDQGMMPPPRYG